MKRVVPIFVVLVVVLGGGFWLKIRQNREALLAPSGGNGVIEGQEVDVAARMPGRILRIAAAEGARVQAGQVLVELDCREAVAMQQAALHRVTMAQKQARAAKAQIEAALGAAGATSATFKAAGAQTRALEANRKLAEKQKSRVEKLKGEGSATEVELDTIATTVDDLGQRIQALKAQTAAAQGQATAARAQARAVAEQAEVALTAIEAARADAQRAAVAVEECHLRAPISGLVLTRAFEPGEVVLPGSRILTLIRLDPVETTFYLPNRELGAAAPGKAVTLSADAYPKRAFAGRILSVSSEAEFTPRTVQTREDRDRLVYQVKVTVPNADGALRPGMPVEVAIDGTGSAK